jgi:hypothetical protein
MKSRFPIYVCFFSALLASLFLTREQWASLGASSFRPLCSFANFTGDAGALPHKLEPKINASWVVLVTNPASSVQRRQWLRAQWARSLGLIAKDQQTQVVMKFFVGNTTLSPDERDIVQAEHAAFGDILLLEVADRDNPDPPPPGSGSATTLKVMHGMRWAVEHFQFDYFVRLGDDSYLRIDFLLELSKGWPREKMYRGACDQKFTQPAKHPGVSASVVGYCSGMGFIVSYDAAQYVSNNELFLDVGYPEDVVVGSWFVGTSFDVIDDKGFVHDRETACNSSSAVLIHRMDQKAYWDMVDESGVMRC